MTGIENLKTRLTYRGGNQEQRMQQDKLNTLKKALLYSYQAATARLADGREFRCLINPDKINNDYDNKILSIPYKDVCLNKPKLGKTTDGIEETGIKPGDVFEWVETGTYWIIYLQYLEEDAYFRAQIRRCEAEIEIGENKYKVYVRGPVETTIQWNQKKGDIWNDINYSLIVYITKNEETLDYFHRFTKVKIDGKMWEVKVVDPYHGDGVIEICLGEWYNNTIAEEAKKEQDAQPKPEPPAEDSIYIDGPAEVHAFDTKCEYSIKNAGGGIWVLKTKKAVIRHQTAAAATLDITTGRSGSFTLYYQRENEPDIELPITIRSI